MKLGVIFTGGTIGSQLQADGFLAPVQSSDWILQQAADRGFLSGLQLVPTLPMQILSEEMNASTLNALISHVRNRMKTEDCSGYLLFHGTDTLAYTAALLSMMLGNVKTPLVLIASNDPLTNPNANGWSNLEYALRFLQMPGQRGVFVCNCNEDAIPTMHYADKLLQQRPNNGDIFSINEEICGYFDKDKQWHSVGERKMEDGIFSGTLMEMPPIFWAEAGVERRYGRLPEDTRAVLFTGYHSGTFGHAPAFLELVRQAKAMGIPFYLVGCDSGMTPYESIRDMELLGITPLYDMAPIAAYCKLWIMLSQAESA